MSLNRVMLIGNLGKDPEVANGQTTMCRFSVACTEKWKDKNGDKQEKTEWVNCTVWGGLADVCAKYLQKGSKVYVEGSLETRTYEKDGEKRYATGVRVRDVQFLDSKPQGDRSSRPRDVGYEPEPQNRMDDDIPF